MLVKSKINGSYHVCFSEDFTSDLKKDIDVDECFFLIDKNVYRLYKKQMGFIKKERIYFLNAIETNKTLDKVQEIIKHLLENKFKKNHRIVAIGGGITQDLACFISSTLFRGVKWSFYPTTLLAQCDSCIGSKSSINIGSFKNQVGTFYPPQQIVIDVKFLKTLEKEQLLSGLGEAIKVHYLDNKMRYQQVYDDYGPSQVDNRAMMRIIRGSLLIKRDIIEFDEFDRNYRNIMNYGHTFGHALEASTNYEIPHGLAVTIGMGVANYISLNDGMITQEIFNKMEALIQKNSRGVRFSFENIKEAYWESLKKDKKNIDDNIMCILTEGFGKMNKHPRPLDENTKNLILSYMEKYQ